MLETYRVGHCYTFTRDTTEAVDEGLKKLKTGTRGEQKVMLDAVKIQISFRKKNLSQEIPAKLSCFSQDKKAFSLADLTQRLKTIVQLKQPDLGPK